MVYQRVAQYLWLKGDTYYFNRRVPKDMQGHYKSSRIVICLKTTRKDTAARSARSIAQRLEDYWLSLRLANLDIPALHLLRDRPLKVSQSSCMTLSDALELYLRLKGVNKGKVFRRGAERNIQSALDVLSDRPLFRIAPGTRRPHMCLAHIVRLSQGYAGLFPFLSQLSYRVSPRFVGSVLSSVNNGSCARCEQLCLRQR